MIRTMTRVKRIPLLALFFVSAMEFILERAGTDLVLMTGALAVLLWEGRGTRNREVRAVRVVIALPQWRGNNLHRTPRQHSGHRRRWEVSGDAKTAIAGGASACAE
jgi:hypothetical protein